MTPAQLRPRAQSALVVQSEYAHTGFGRIKTVGRNLPEGPYKPIDITDGSGDVGYDSDKLNEGGNALIGKAKADMDAAWYVRTLAKRNVARLGKLAKQLLGNLRQN